MPIDSGRHVYSNWEPVMERRGSYHAALGAFRRAQSNSAQMIYGPDVCPRALGVLRGTVFLSIRPEWNAEDVRKRIQTCLTPAHAIGNA